MAADALLDRYQNAFRSALPHFHRIDAPVAWKVVEEWSILAAVPGQGFDFDLLRANLCPLYQEILCGDHIWDATNHIKAYKERSLIPKSIESRAHVPISLAGWARVHYVAAAGDARAMKALIRGSNGRECLDAVCPAGTAAFLACSTEVWSTEQSTVETQRRKGHDVLRALVQGATDLNCLTTWINRRVPVFLLGTATTVVEFVLTSMDDARLVEILLDAGATIGELPGHLHALSFTRQLHCLRHLRPVSAAVKSSLAGIRLPHRTMKMLITTPPSRLLHLLPLELVDLVVEYLVGTSPWVVAGLPLRWDATLAVRRSMDQQ